MRLATHALALSFVSVVFAQNAPMAAGTDHEKPPVPPSHSLNVTFQNHTVTLKIDINVMTVSRSQPID